jgi:hypothetical protein
MTPMVWKMPPRRLVNRVLEYSTKEWSRRGVYSLAALHDNLTG